MAKNEICVNITAETTQFERNIASLKKKLGEAASLSAYRRPLSRPDFTLPPASSILRGKLKPTAAFRDE